MLKVEKSVQKSTSRTARGYWDSVDDVSCSKFQDNILTQTSFEMTQFKMPCGTYDTL